MGTEVLINGLAGFGDLLHLRRDLLGLALRAVGRRPVHLLQRNLNEENCPAVSIVFHNVVAN